MVLLVEKLFLHFVAINFHEKALAERLVENRLGLKALDRLSNAHPNSVKKSPHVKRDHKSTPSRSGTFDPFPEPNRPPQVSTEGSLAPGEQSSSSLQNDSFEKWQTQNKKRKRKRAMAGVIVDQVRSFVGPLLTSN
jgi:hypothetical protein